MDMLIHPMEKVYFVISLAFSLAVYAGVIAVGIYSPQTFLIFGIYIVAGFLFAGIVQGMFIGHLRGNGIRVSEKQFAEVYRAVQQAAQRMGMRSVPAIYVVQAGGLINAFATKFLGRNFVVIYSDVLELAYEKGESELSFVVCHELAHIKRKHLTWRKVLFPALIIPLLPLAYSRACEYTCDRFGAHYVPEGAVGGVLVLAAGKKLYRNVDVSEFREQATRERGFWIWYAELLSTHPNLPKRLAAVERFRGPLQAGSVTAAPA